MRRCSGWEEGCLDASGYGLTPGLPFCPVYWPVGRRRRLNRFSVGSSRLRGPRRGPSNGSLPLLRRDRLRERPSDAACIAWSIWRMRLGPLTKQAAAPRYLRGKCVARPSEGEDSQLLQNTPNEKAVVGLRPSFSSHVRFGERGAPVLAEGLDREPDLAGLALWYPTSREKRARYGAPRDPWHDKGPDGMVRTRSGQSSFLAGERQANRTRSGSRSHAVIANW
jgi:hypothetical protein